MNEEQPASGARGRAITPMYPSGKVLIDGVEYSARFKSGFAKADDEVIVVGLDAFGLIVGKPDPQDKGKIIDHNVATALVGDLDAADQRLALGPVHGDRLKSVRRGLYQDFGVPFVENPNLPRDASPVRASKKQQSAGRRLECHHGRFTATDMPCKSTRSIQRLIVPSFRNSCRECRGNR